MSRIQVAVGRIKQASFDGGLGPLADAAGVKRSTARDLLKADHKALKNLLALEAAAEKKLATADPQT